MTNSNVVQWYLFYLVWSPVSCIFQLQVPIRQLDMKPECALEQFTSEFPTLALLGKHHFVKPNVPFVLDSEVQVVCKYLKAYDDTDRNGRKRIDRLYPKCKKSSSWLITWLWQVWSVLLFSTAETHWFPPYDPKPVKFSMDSDLSIQECQYILSKHMEEYMKKNKLTQKMFIRYRMLWSGKYVIEGMIIRLWSCAFHLSNNYSFRYMYRRCSFLDNLPAFNFNNGAGDWQHDGKLTDTTKLGSTLMTAMLQEVKDICDPTANQNWAHKTHQQVFL